MGSSAAEVPVQEGDDGRGSRACGGPPKRPQRHRLIGSVGGRLVDRGENDATRLSISMGRKESRRGGAVRERVENEADWRALEKAKKSCSNFL